VTTQDGASTLACGEHLWTVRTPEDRRDGMQRTIQTQEMAGRLKDTAGHRYELPLVEPVEFVPQDVPTDPYDVGRALGGRSGSPGAPDVPPSAAGGAAVVTAPARTIPDEYLLNSSEVRRAVLDGVLEGTAAVEGADGSLRLVAGTLVDQVVFLVRSLGGVVTKVEDDLLEVRLPGRSRPVRFIDSIEPAGEAETVCISVAAEDSLYVTEDFLVTHNTLNDAFIILDEAQNTSPEQMKMFLTRLGFGSKIVVTGDVTQIDLPGGVKSGLKVIEEILTGVEDVSFNRLTSHDVVRHRLVGRIVAAYDAFEAGTQRGSARP
jgi:phosphate starvation-inducible PhoH-like protein